RFLNMYQIRSTYKAPEVEETLDIFFYRPFGYILAKISGAFGLTPDAVTILSMIIGVIAGHLFYYQSMALNIAGILLLIFSEALDSADGQLARITGIKSKHGRILDGLAGNIAFISIYLNIYARLLHEGASPSIILLIIFAGVSHSFQSAMADYYRNGFLYFAVVPQKAELERSANIAEKYLALSWIKNTADKFFMRIYLNYTREQELLSPNFQKLFNTAKSVYQDNIPEFFRNEYSKLNRPLIKYYNILTTNTRMIFLFVVLLMGMPFLYFLFELFVLNLLLAYVIIRQESINRSLLNILSHSAARNKDA
ncbi:MAG: CDP-alcohol phosphatidyltransferase family protein, partial [Syntrophothermus sp.]